MKNHPDDTPISEAFRRLQCEVDVPPLDPGREQALLAAFDAHWARPRPSVGRWVWTIAAAVWIVIAVTVDWVVVTHAPRNGVAASEAIVDLGDFVPWPGAQAWPPFESGELMRVDLPLSALPALGLLPPVSPASIVQADIVVGQDGFARAVRLVR
jgi:hypothetical protein